MCILDNVQITCKSTNLFLSTRQFGHTNKPLEQVQITLHFQTKRNGYTIVQVISFLNIEEKEI